MTYAVLNLVVLTALVLVLAPRLRRLCRSPLLWTALAMMALTAVFDNAMITAQLVRYAPETILGVKVGVAPVEDFAYTLAAAVLMPALWATFRDRGPSAAAAGRSAPAEVTLPPDPAGPAPAAER